MQEWRAGLKVLQVPQGTFDGMSIGEVLAFGNLTPAAKRKVVAARRAKTEGVGA
jgi:hypothetical protein